MIVSLNKVLLSIIVPAYNVERYISSCIESILNQPFQDFEIIIVNDGSTDGTLHICETLAASDSRIIVIDQENGGLGNARNRALDIARGKYISFIDSDDAISNDFYENISILEKDETIDFVRVPILFLDNKGKILKRKMRKLRRLQKQRRCILDGFA